MQGEQNRQFAATLINDHSSRSHTVFQMRMESRPIAGARQEELAEYMHAVAAKVQQIQGHLCAERATFYIVNRGTNKLESHASSLAGACATSGQTILIDDVYKDARFDRSFDKRSGFCSQSTCIVPIICNNVVLAVVQFVNKLPKAGIAIVSTQPQPPSSVAGARRANWPMVANALSGAVVKNTFIDFEEEKAMLSPKSQSRRKRRLKTTGCTPNPFDQFDEAEDNKSMPACVAMSSPLSICEKSTVCPAPLVFTLDDAREAEEFARQVAPLMAAAEACARVSRAGLLNLVDLAGSECISKAGPIGSSVN